jgi:hypothetical protein
MACFIGGLSSNFTIPGVTTELKDSNGNIVLGGGIQGFMPKHHILNNNLTNFDNVRINLRKGWNNNYRIAPGCNKTRITPFRVVTNSGDLLSRNYYSCGGSSQVSQSRPGLFGLNIGSIQENCDGSGVPPATCNVKYVYDSSNYTTFLKQQAIYKNYNDLSNGGDNHNASQVKRRSIRRF